jgi:hypothetical protein
MSIVGVIIYPAVKKTHPRPPIDEEGEIDLGLAAARRTAQASPSNALSHGARGP